jgi:hypothetical protein
MSSRAPKRISTPLTSLEMSIPQKNNPQLRAKVMAESTQDLSLEESKLKMLVPEIISHFRDQVVNLNHRETS